MSHATLGLAIATLFSPVSGRAASLYAITDLGTLGGAGSRAHGVGPSGLVAGEGQTSGGASVRAFIFDGSTLHSLGTLGGTNSYGYGVNSAGQACGESEFDGSGSTHAFRYSGGVMSDLGTLGGSYSFGYSINDSGAVVGGSFISGDAAARAFLFKGGTMLSLGTLGGTSSFAWGINRAGQIAGESDVAGDAATHAFLYSGGVMSDLGTLGGRQSFGYGINSAGNVTGQSGITGNTAIHAFLYGTGIMHDLGTLGGTTSSGHGINTVGQVTGVSDLPGDATSHAFLYSNGVMRDLNSLIDASSGWELTQSSAINDQGQVVGWGLIGGQEHAFLLTPPRRAMIVDGSTIFHDPGALSTPSTDSCMTFPPCDLQVPPSTGACESHPAVPRSKDITYCILDGHGTPVPNCPVAVRYAPVQRTGGHCHSDPSRPVQYPAAAVPRIVSGNTGANGLGFVVPNTWPEESGAIDVRFYATNASFPFFNDTTTSFTLCVEVAQFHELAAGPGYDKIGSLPEHVANHFGTAALLSTLPRLAVDFSAAYPTTRLGYNDMSLPWGGVLDLNENWQAPHCGHRVGTTVDVRSRNLNPGQRQTLRVLLKKYGLQPHFEDTHWHCVLLGHQ